MTALLTLYTPS